MAILSSVCFFLFGMFSVIAFANALWLLPVAAAFLCLGIVFGLIYFD